MSTGADVSLAPSIKQSAIVSERGSGRGHGHDRDFGHGSFGGRGFYGGRQSLFDKGPQQCKHYGRNNHLLKVQGEVWSP